MDRLFSILDQRLWIVATVEKYCDNINALQTPRLICFLMQSNAIGKFAIIVTDEPGYSGTSE